MFEQTCVACQKVYHSQNAYEEHLETKKHKTREALFRQNNKDDQNSTVSGTTFSLGEPISETLSRDATQDKEISEVENGIKNTSLKTDESKPKHEEKPEGAAGSGEKSPEPAQVDPDFPLTHCIFCNAEAESIQANADHMGKVHSMFVPERTYLVDPMGLLRYLYAKISENHECLYCHKLKVSAPAIQTHMRDKGHCKIAFETEEEMLEVGQFYDFSSTYSDDDGSDAASNSDVDETADGNQDGWETDSSASSAAPRGNKALASDFELHLPTGRTAGHRSLAKYYRQNLRNYPTQEERQARLQAITEGPHADLPPQMARGRDSNRAIVTRANGGLGLLGATDHQRSQAKVAERRGRSYGDRKQRQYQWTVEKRANNQKHYRVSLLSGPRKRVCLLWVYIMLIAT